MFPFPAPLLCKAEDAGGGDWTPSNLSSKVGWWRADTGLTLSGTAVQAWAPKEGSGTFNFTGVAPVINSTAINSLPAIDNTSGGGTLSLSYTNTTAIISVAFIGTVHNGGSSFGRQVSLGNSGLSGDWNNNSTFNVGRDSSNAGFAVQRNSITSTVKTVTYDAPFICVVVWDGTTGSFYVDGTLVGTLSNSNNFNINLMRLWQSAKSGSAGDFGRGICPDLVLSNVAFSTTERQKLEGYFAWRYGMTSDLPAGHPYKSVAPTV